MWSWDSETVLTTRLETVFTKDMSNQSEPQIHMGTAHVPGNATIHRAFMFEDGRNIWMIACGSSGTAGTRIIVDPAGDTANITCGRCKR